MTEYLLNLLFWKDTATTYLYGSKIKFLADSSVVFQNELMSPGKKIVTWTSSTNYQADRISPQLPLIEENHRYKVRLKANSYPEKSLMMMIEFFRQDHSLIQKKYISDVEGDFLCPKDCYRYTISLINAGCESIHFRRIELFPVQNSAMIPLNDDYQFQTNVEEWDRNKKLNIFFKEPALNVATALKAKQKSIEANYVIVESLFPTGKLFLDEQVRNFLSNIDYTPKSIVCWGSGKYSNFAAAYYKDWLDAQQLNIVATDYAIEDYKRSYELVAAANFATVQQQLFDEAGNFLDANIWKSLKKDSLAESLVDIGFDDRRGDIYEYS